MLEAPIQGEETEDTQIISGRAGSEQRPDTKTHALHLRGSLSPCYTFHEGKSSRWGTYLFDHPVVVATGALMLLGLVIPLLGTKMNMSAVCTTLRFLSVCISITI